MAYDDYTDYEQQQTDLRRRRAQAALLQNQDWGLGSKMVGGQLVGGGWTQALGDALKGVMGGVNNTVLDREQKDLDQSRAQAMQHWLAQRPEDIPATTGVVGSGPIAPPPGTPGVEPPANMQTPMNTPEPGPNAPASAFSTTPPDSQAGWVGPKGVSLIPQGADFTPNVAPTPMVPASLNKVAAWAAGGDRFGPMMGKFGEKTLDLSVAAPEKLRLLQEAQQTRAAAQQQARDDRAHELELARIEKARLAETAQAEREAQHERDAANRRADQDARAADRQALASLATKSGGGSYLNVGTTLDGNQVLRNSKDPNDQVAVINGKAVPHNDVVVSPGEEKDVKAAMAAANEANQSLKLAAEVRKPENKDVFGPQANVGTSVSSFFGGAGKQKLSGLNEDQLQLRGVIGRDFAETTKKLYGASFTASEQARANTFTPQSQDDNIAIAKKLEGAAQFQQQMAEKYGTKIQKAAAARMRPPIESF